MIVRFFESTSLSQLQKEVNESGQPKRGARVYEKILSVQLTAVSFPVPVSGFYFKYLAAVTYRDAPVV